MKWIFILLALAVGVFVPLQAGVNVRLKHALGNDYVLAAFISFMVGTLALGGYVLAFNSGFSGLSGSLPASSWQA